MDNGLHFLTVSLMVCACGLQISVSAPVTQETTCNHRVADIVFVLDTSKSIWEDDFTQQLKFVENIVNRFPVSKRGVHVGVLIFGSEVYPQFYLNDYYSKAGVLQAISEIEYIGGATKTGSAIKHARESMFSTENGAREGVDKIMYVITDGFSVNKSSTSLEASLSKSEGITMLAIGVGYGVDAKELTDIASRRTEHAHFVFRVDDFSALETIQEVVTQTACDIMAEDVTTDTEITVEDIRKYCGNKPADVIFVIDSSSSVKETNFAKIISFVTETVGMFDIGLSTTRVGVVTYSDEVHPEILLDNGLSKTTLQEHILQLPFHGGGTQTSLALQYLHKHGFHNAHARNGVTRVAILLTDGQSENPSHTLKEATRLRRKGVHIFALGMPGHVDRRELQAIASEPADNYVFEVDYYDALPSIKDTLAFKACSVNEGTHVAQNDRGFDVSKCRAKEDVDIMYLYDSNSIGPKRAAEVRQAILEAMEVTQSPDIRSGIVSKSCKSITEPGLMMSPSKELIADNVKTLQEDVLPEMLHDLRIRGFSAQNGGRHGARNVAFLIIEGDMTDYHYLRMEARRLRFREAVELYIVGIGLSSEDQLAEIVSQPAVDHILQFGNFRQLQNLKSSIFDIMCVY